MQGNGAAGDVPALLAEIARSGARFGATADGLTDSGVRAPSRLPGWTRGHVLAHVARGLDAYTWLLGLARTGVQPGPRAGAAESARAVAEGAARPAAELAGDVRTALRRMTAQARALPAGAWSTRVTALAGWAHPAWFTLFRCLRELETHHVDLDAGYGTADRPAGYVLRALESTVPTLAVREFPLARIEAVDLGRAWTVTPGAGRVAAGPGHALLGWLTGRAPGAPVAAGGRGLPVPPPWPLPPVPGWGGSAAGVS